MNHFNRFAAPRQPLGRVTKVVLFVVMLAAGVPTHGQALNAAAPAAAVTPVHAGVQAIAGQSADPQASAIAHKKNYEFAVKDGDWQDTGVVLAAGEKLHFAATGSASLEDGRTVDPDGAARGWRDLLRQFPLNDANTGALVGRVGDLGASVPFLVGKDNDLVVPANGRLYLRMNLSNDLTATGNFKVKLTFEAEAKAKAVASSPNVSKLVSPATFAGIPRRVSDDEGHEGDMVNYALIGTEDQVQAAFKAAGWVPVDKSVGDALLHGILSTMSHEPYTEMPMSTLYLFGRPQDLSFARGDPLKVAAERHHLRTWKTDTTINGKPLWVGSATHDIGFERDQRNGGVTHKIDPEIDKERDFLLQSFEAAGAFSSAAYVTPEDPMLKAKTATGGGFYSDGRIVVMDLK